MGSPFYNYYEKQKPESTYWRVLFKVSEKSFTNKLCLIKHQNLHIGEKHFQCKICEKSISKQLNPFQHQIVHTEDKPFHCKDCEKRFTVKIKSISIPESTHWGEAIHM